MRFLGEVSGFSPNAVSALLVVFGVACLAGVSITGALRDRFPRGALTTAVATQAVGMLGLHAAGADPVAAVLFLVLTGGALGPVFMATQNEMLQCAPGRTDLALAANSGTYNAGIAAGAALGALVLPPAGVRGTFLAGGLLTVGCCSAGDCFRGAAARSARRVNDVAETPHGELFGVPVAFDRRAGVVPVVTAQGYPKAARLRERMGQGADSVPRDGRVLDVLRDVGRPYELEVDMQKRRPDERDDQTGLADVLPGETGHQRDLFTDQREPFF